MALQTSTYAAAHVPAPVAAAVPIFARQAAEVTLPGTTAASTSNPPLSAGLPSGYASHLQSFPMVPPALSVMIPTNTASQSYHNSPSATQVRSTVSYTLCTSLYAKPASPRMHLQVDVLALRLVQDLAFQQAVQRNHVQGAAKAAVALLGVRPALQHPPRCQAKAPSAHFHSTLLCRHSTATRQVLPPTLLTLLAVSSKKETGQHARY